MKNKKPNIAVLIGDPSGIGPELISKLLTKREISEANILVIGEKNILNKLPVSASSLYSKNVFNFVDNLFDKEHKKININLEDEIIEKTLIK